MAQRESNRSDATVRWAFAREGSTERLLNFRKAEMQIDSRTGHHEKIPHHKVRDFFIYGLCGNRKGGTSAHTGAKTCRWHVFSPWEIPWSLERSR